MIKLKEIEKEIKEILSYSEANRGNMKVREKNKAQRRIRYLATIKAYLASCPTEEYLIKERDRLQNRLQRIEDGFAAWKELNIRSGKKTYYGLHDVDKLKTQIKEIKFLLGQ